MGSLLLVGGEQGGRFLRGRFGGTWLDGGRRVSGRGDVVGGGDGSKIGNWEKRKGILSSTYEVFKQPFLS